ncbi:Coiled-coil domain-containing protein 19 mitochondrial [Paragonimus heterotremus]|uniref:Cilia- and flagella-associated protein 45 n=1 Tax=Paragonimus heterotremus TaxID=100268 RepID=A0A8J4STQ5_9TREM|nr:Coiled-coil domain-containing protein 19 mitochondrial [Paragonimus heterotremus]
MPTTSIHSGPSQTASQQSSKSSSSRKSKISCYRTVGKQSVVDENLFGEPYHVKELARNVNNKAIEGPEITVIRPKSSNDNCDKERIFRGHKRIRHISSDLVRDIIIPDDDSNTKSIILSKKQYDELTEKAKIVTDEDEKEALRTANEIKLSEAAASQARKEQMRQHDLARHKNAKLTDLEEEARKQAEVLLQKALEQRQDQEDEIRELNELILNAKIQAIRDEQILEKQQIKKEMSEEELRLDNMMELARQDAIRIQEEIDKKRHEQEMLGACQVLNQIQQNRQDRLLELERNEQENALAQQRINEELLKEIANREVKHQMQAKIRTDLNNANDDMRRRRAEEQERDRLFDLKILEIQKEKAEREAAYEAEQARIRQEKELEIARLRALQERASDEAAERDALRAKRAAEAREREWRLKEKADALKKQETEDLLKRARITQAEERRRLLAIEAGRERMEFERILKRQKEMMDNDQREQNEAKLKNQKYAEEIRRQICLKEQERISERNAFFEEGVRLEEEARLRRMRLMDAKNRKLKELRAAGIPEKYLHQVERKALQTGEGQKQ